MRRETNNYPKHITIYLCGITLPCSSSSEPKTDGLALVQFAPRRNLTKSSASLSISVRLLFRSVFLSRFGSLNNWGKNVADWLTLRCWKYSWKRWICHGDLQARLKSSTQGTRRLRKLSSVENKSERRDAAYLDICDLCDSIKPRALR